MKHACETCGQKYAIPDDRLAGKVLRIRCQKCEGTMRVDGTGISLSASRAPQPSPSRLPPTRTDVREWYLGLAGQPYGPYCRREVMDLVEVGEVRARTLMWRHGIDAWQRVCETTALAWVWEAVQDREARAGAEAYRTPTNLFEQVPTAMVHDGRAYFPDPTLHSGWSVLSDDAQRYLQAVARREARSHLRAEAGRYVAMAVAFVALTVVGAAGAWAATSF